MRILKLMVCVGALAACAAAATNLNGAGATFPNPIYQKWFSEYHNAHSDVQINYQSVGSGAGIQQLTAGTVDFGAADVPMTDQQIAELKSKRKIDVLHIPTVAGAVVPIYNVPGVSAEVKFTGQLLANIFLGKITNWNDAQIAKVNPALKFPDKAIIVVHRAEGSGTTFIFADYLSKISPEWRDGPGKGASIRWPVGLGGKGNEQVAGLVRQNEGAIGYVELIYAVQNHIAFGSVQNAAGEFIKASLESTTEAAASVKQMPADLRFSMTNAPGKNAYPIASFTWLLIPLQWQDQAKKQVVIDFLNWMLASGEGMAKDLSYAQLPSDLANKVKDKIKQIH